MGKFLPQLRVGHKAEGEYEILVRQKSWHKIRYFLKYDDSSLDRMAVFGGGKKGFEIKFDVESVKYGNIVLEIFRTADGMFGESTGLSVTQADYWIQKAWWNGQYRYYCAVVDELKKALLHEADVEAWDVETQSRVIKRVLTLNPVAKSLGLCDGWVNLKRKTIDEGNPPTRCIKCNIERQVLGSDLWFDMEDLKDGSWNF